MVRSRYKDTAVETDKRDLLTSSSLGAKITLIDDDLVEFSMALDDDEYSRHMRE